MDNHNNGETMEQEIFKGYVTLQEAESLSAIRVDRLRKLIRQGRLESIQPCGRYSPHLLDVEGLKSFVDSLND